LKYLLSKIVLLATALSLAMSAQTESSAIPTIHFSLYAPVQKDPPVRLVGFEHDGRHVHFVLSNVSDKPVSAVLVGRVDIVPTGCALEPRREDMAFMSVGGVGLKLPIPPHGKAIGSRAGIFPGEGGGMTRDPAPIDYPKWFVYIAKGAGAAYMQIQFGVTGVYFEDGSVWPAKLDRLSPGNPAEPFDKGLVKAEAGKCPDVARVANALKSVEEVVFAPETSEVENGETVPGIPQLHCSCKLEGKKAMCQLPRETGQVSARPAVKAEN
jgi:hypothetical protein